MLWVTQPSRTPAFLFRQVLKILIATSVQMPANIGKIRKSEDI